MEVLRRRPVLPKISSDDLDDFDNDDFDEFSFMIMMIFGIILTILILMIDQPGSFATEACFAEDIIRAQRSV